MTESLILSWRSTSPASHCLFSLLLAGQRGDSAQRDYDRGIEVLTLSATQGLEDQLPIQVH